MKAKFILTILLMTLCAKSFAQDIIHTNDSQPIEAKVTEITDEYVRYKTFDNLEGPDYRIALSHVVRIVFENGTEKVFATLNNEKEEEYNGPYGPLAYRAGVFYDNLGRLYSKQLKKCLGESVYKNDYRKARNQFLWGSGLTVGGTTLLVGALAGGGMYTLINNKWGPRVTQSASTGKNEVINSKAPVVAIVAIGVAGAACIGAGIPLWVKGNRKLGAIADDYNLQHPASDFSYRPSLTLGATANGFGLALTF